MQLVDIEQIVKYAVYDDVKQKWFFFSGTIKEFLNTFCDAKNLNIYNVDCDFLWNYETKQ